MQDWLAEKNLDRKSLAALAANAAIVEAYEQYCAQEVEDALEAIIVELEAAEPSRELVALDTSTSEAGEDVAEAKAKEPTARLAAVTADATAAGAELRQLADSDGSGMPLREDSGASEGHSHGRSTPLLLEVGNGRSLGPAQSGQAFTLNSQAQIRRVHQRHTSLHMRAFAQGPEALLQYGASSHEAAAGVDNGLPSGGITCQQLVSSQGEGEQT